MFVKIQTWFAFNIQICINGRELMKHVFDANDISYECYDNSFTSISDVAKTQALADKFDFQKLCRHLDGFAKSLNPFLDTVQKSFGQGYYWCVDQCEFASDIMFQERSLLEDIYPSLVGHAFYDFPAPMSSPLWGANRTRGFRERQSPTIRSVPLAAG